MVDDLEAFLYSLPSLVRQAERNIRINVNTLEFMERRLDDSAFAVGVIVHNCLEYNGTNKYDLLTQQLFQLYSVIQNMCDQYTEMCSLYRDYSAELGYICPVHRSGIRGRPKFDIPVENHCYNAQYPLQVEHYS